MMERMIQKKARTLSAFEQLGISNRSIEKKIPNSMSKESADVIADYIAKTAKDINRAILDLQYDNLSKQANVIDASLASKAGNMLMQRLGMDPQNSIDMVSQIVKNTLRIQEVYGGESDLIMSRLIDEIENSLSTKYQGKLQNPSHEIDNMHQSMMNPFRAKKTEERLKFDIMSAVRVSSSEAEQISKNLISEARDLLIQLRPYSLDEICNAIIHLIQRFNDSTIVYGIRNNRSLISQLKSILSQRG